MAEFWYRTFETNPSAYERALAEALFAIMGRCVHDPAEIAAELNKTGPQPEGGTLWTAELLKAELKRLGTWTNSIGTAVGGHATPGISERVI